MCSLPWQNYRKAPQDRVFGLLGVLFSAVASRLLFCQFCPFLFSPLFLTIWAADVPLMSRASVKIPCMCTSDPSRHHSFIQWPEKWLPECPMGQPQSYSDSWFLPRPFSRQTPCSRFHCSWIRTSFTFLVSNSSWFSYPYLHLLYVFELLTYCPGNWLWLK